MQQMMMDESNPKWSQYLSQSSSVIVPVASLPCNNDLPAESWSQLLLGGVVEEEEKYEMSLHQPKDADNWEDEQRAMNTPLVSASTAADHVVSGYFQGNGSGEEEKSGGIVSWRQILPTAAATTSLFSSVMDFSNSMEDNKRHHPDTECNRTSTVEAHKKKARVQVSSAQCAFKVRKEKLGDRITALHQLVSPFGKTDTASVLLEAIGYIRFLQSQIEVLSTPYLGCGSRNRRQPAFLHEKKRGPQDDEEEMHNKDEQPKKDLRSRGLCLVPVAFTLHVGNDTSAADFWAPAFSSGGSGGLRFQ